VSKFQIQNFKIKKKIEIEIEFEIKKLKVKLKKYFLKKSQFFIFSYFFAIFLLLIIFSKNHISVSVLTTPVNFWSMTDRTPVFHLDTLNYNFSYLKKKLLAPNTETLWVALYKGMQRT
jgi:hypothetical protein